MGLISWIKGLINQAIRKFKAFIAAALPEAKQIAIGYLSDMASKVVAEVDLKTLKDEDKRKEAFDRIKTYAVMHGIEARDSLINLILEIAVQKLKG